MSIAEKAEEKNDAVQVPHLQSLLNGLASAHAPGPLRRSPELAIALNQHQILSHLNVRSFLSTRLRNILRTRLIKVTVDRDLHLALVITAEKANLIKDTDLHTRHLLHLRVVNLSWILLTRILDLEGLSDPSGIGAGTTNPMENPRALRLPSHLDLNMNP